MSRRGLLIRVLIFGPLFVYFGVAAIQKCNAEKQAERDMAADETAREAEIKAATTKRPLPGGGSIDVVELSPEQAERLYGIKQAPESATPPKPATEAEAPGLKAPDVAPPAAPPVMPTDAKAN